MEKNKVAVFLDGANFFFMQKEALNWFADPKKILEFIEKQYGEIEEAYYYIGQDAPPEAKQKAFLNKLPQMGYSLVSKQIKSIFDHKTGISKKKANLDIEIAIDMFNTIDRYDVAVLISGDGDFERAVDLLKSRGKKVIVMATDKFVAKELKAFAGRNYVRLDDIRTEIERVHNN
jgi:uncharacterized LabA/DUF88 family protein